LVIASSAVLAEDSSSVKPAPASGSKHSVVTVQWGMSNNCHQGANMSNAILRLPAAKLQSGYSRSTIYLRIAQGLWTKQVSLGSRAIGWPAHEVAVLNAARISGKTDTQIRELVIKLEAARKAVI
jgi:prophage regulatory protein